MRFRPFLALAFLLMLLFGASWVCRRPLADTRAVVLGRVVAAGSPVAAARVRIKGSGSAVLTDAEGRFRLACPRAPSGRVTVAREGFLIAGADVNRSPLLLDLAQVPAEDNEDYAWVEPAPGPGKGHNCGNCHGEIFQEWSAGAHARSATGRHFRNLYDGTDWHGRPNRGWSLLAEHPEGAGVCTSCHAPTVPFGDPAFFDLRRVSGVAASGVHCDYCHKIADVGPGAIGLTHGRFNLTLRRPSAGQLFFGPLDDVDRHEDVFAPLYRESRYCASCHEGTVFGVHVYGTYSEWLESPARREGKQCQTCHMAATGTLTNIAPGKGGIERDAKTLANHRFFSGSQHEMLRRCLYVSVMATPDDGRVRAEVTVAAEAVGHRVPTGFADRNLMLVVEARDQRGQALLPLDGPTLPSPAGADWAGKPGKLYAKLLKSFDGHGPAPFWRADPDAVDTRLYPGRPDFAHIVFPPGARRLRVRLIYRRFWPEVVKVKEWPDREVTIVDESLNLSPGKTTSLQSPPPINP